MAEKKKGSAGLVILVIILLLVCVGMGGFIFINKDKLLSQGGTTTTVKNSAKETQDGLKECEEISFDLKTDEYGLASKGAGIAVNVDKTRKKAVISYNGATIVETFGMTGTVYALDKTTYETIDTKTFDKKISQVLVDGAGQSATGATILYLMEDGTVEYVPIKKDIDTYWSKPDQTKKFNSYGKLNGISDVISLVPAEASGYHTILARKADGTVKDLSSVLQATGNY